MAPARHARNLSTIGKRRTSRTEWKKGGIMRFLDRIAPVVLIATVLCVPVKVGARAPSRPAIGAADNARCSALKKLDLSGLEEAPSHILDSHSAASSNESPG